MGEALKDAMNCNAWDWWDMWQRGWFAGGLITKALYDLGVSALLIYSGWRWRRSTARQERRKGR